MNATRTLVLISAVVAGAAACGSQSPPSVAFAAEQRPSPATVPQPPAPANPVVEFTRPPAAYTGPLPPLPKVSYPLPRSPQVIEAVYAFAARHPEVLHYVPCFCGCQRSGHKDNDDCFIKGRDAKGRPEWEAHGMG
jgi:hypothetical protein